MFIFIGVKIIKVEETTPPRLIKSFQTVQNSQVKGTLTRRGIMKRRNFIQDWIPLDNGWWRSKSLQSLAQRHPWHLDPLLEIPKVLLRVFY